MVMGVPGSAVQHKKGSGDALISWVVVRRAGWHTEEIGNGEDGKGSHHEQQQQQDEEQCQPLHHTDI